MRKKHNVHDRIIFNPNKFIAMNICNVISNIKNIRRSVSDDYMLLKMKDIFLIAHQIIKSGLLGLQNGY
ncbi:hypothetical protein DMB44_03820 [Thermoplasma sp. Kam2015]|nr:hypothetical protein DMB44_03820 [Thermoplasma sp. Kam2015]